MSRFPDFLRNVLLWIVILLSVCLIVLAVLPRALGYTACGVQDNSMEPDVPRGALVLSKPVAFNEIQVGDVLVFEDPQSGALFTRNVLEVWADKQQLVTIGGTSSGEILPDPMTTAYRCVVGRMQRMFPLLGYPAVCFHSFLGKAVIALLYIIWAAVELERSRAAKKRGAFSCA